MGFRAARLNDDHARRIPPIAVGKDSA
jgi:hypothetical protein